MFWLKKVLVFWTWNYHVLSIYWLSTGGFVPSDSVETDGGPKARREFHMSDTDVITLTRSRPGVRY